MLRRSGSHNNQLVGSRPFAVSADVVVMGVP